MHLSSALLTVRLGASCENTVVALQRNRRSDSYASRTRRHARAKLYHMQTELGQVPPMWRPEVWQRRSCGDGTMDGMDKKANFRFA